MPICVRMLKADIVYITKFCFTNAIIKNSVYHQYKNVYDN